ncbi:unnamed protein product, partial [Larinioides sclopetarius]
MLSLSYFAISNSCSSSHVCTPPEIQVHRTGSRRKRCPPAPISQWGHQQGNRSR